MVQRVLPVVILVLILVAAFGFGSTKPKQDIEIQQGRANQLKNKIKNLFK